MSTVAAYSGMVTDRYTLDDLRFEDMLIEFVGKRVKVTIEDVPEVRGDYSPFSRHMVGVPGLCACGLTMGHHRPVL